MFSPVRWSEAQRRADLLTTPYKSPPIPALEIAESRGINVVFAAFNKFEGDVSGFCDFRAAKLFVNNSERTARKNFTIAHELGHWELHRSLFLDNPDRYTVLPRFTTPDRSDPLEKEANHFAANLLVPQRLLLPVINAPTAQLAHIFGVSREMMEWRVRNVSGR